MSMPLTFEERALLRRLRSSGMKVAAVARAVDCHENVVFSTMRGETGPGRQETWSHRAGALTMNQREEILVGLIRGESLRSIARRLGLSCSTVSREVRTSGGRDENRISPAHVRARGYARRSKVAKFDDPALCAKVTTWLDEFWSPQEIASRLRLEFPNDPTTHVSHETVGQSLFVQIRGELRRELARCLRWGRTVRRSQDRTEKRGKIPDM